MWMYFVVLLLWWRYRKPENEIVCRLGMIAVTIKLLFSFKVAVVLAFSISFISTAASITAIILDNCRVVLIR